MSIQGDRSFSVLRDLYLKVSPSKSRFQDKPPVRCLFRNDAFDFNRSVIVLYAIKVSTHRIAPLYREYYINDRTEFFHFCDTLLGIRLNDFLQVVHNDIDSQCSRLRNFIRKFVGSWKNSWRFSASRVSRGQYAMRWKQPANNSAAQGVSFHEHFSGVGTPRGTRNAGSVVISPVIRKMHRN